MVNGKTGFGSVSARMAGRVFVVWMCLLVFLVQCGGLLGLGCAFLFGYMCDVAFELRAVCHATRIA